MADAIGLASNLSLKSCGLSTEFLALNSANGVNSVSGIKSKAED